jgi:hypothetical protein
MPKPLYCHWQCCRFLLAKRLGGSQNPSVCRGEEKNFWSFPEIEPAPSRDRICGRIDGNSANKVITTFYTCSLNNLIAHSVNSPPFKFFPEFIFTLSGQAMSSQITIILSTIHSNSQESGKVKKTAKSWRWIYLSFTQDGGELTLISWGWEFYFRHRHCCFTLTLPVTNKNNSKHFRQWNTLTQISPP